MLKHLSVFAALIAFGSGPLYAQKQEAVLQHIEVPGAEFDFVLAAPKPGARVLPDLGGTPDALVVHLHGGELALVFEDAEKMIEALDVLRSPIYAFQADRSGDKPARPGALYVVPKGRRIALGSGMTRAQAWEVENERWPALMPNPNDAVETMRPRASADRAR